jgi:hypothetical protein
MRTSCSVVVLALLAAPAGADVSVTVTTTPNGGQYAPKNVVAVWVEDAAGSFIKTIDRFSQVRTQHLVAWVAAATLADADAVSGATRANHTAPLTMTWDLRDKAGALVPDGTYTIRMELADSNASQPGQNHQGTFTFVKSAAPEQQSGLANGGFTNVAIDFQPVPDEPPPCGDCTGPGPDPQPEQGDLSGGCSTGGDGGALGLLVLAALSAGAGAARRRASRARAASTP